MADPVGPVSGASPDNFDRATAAMDDALSKALFDEPLAPQQFNKDFSPASVLPKGNQSPEASSFEPMAPQQFNEDFSPSSVLPKDGQWAGVQQDPNLNAKPDKKDPFFGTSSQEQLGAPPKKEEPTLNIKITPEELKGVTPDPFPDIKF